MAGNYQSTGGDIGTLLRLIQEDKSSSVLANPAAEVASPIRGVTQAPLMSPEAPGGTRVVSLRPEGSALGVSGPGQGVVQPGQMSGPMPAPGGVVGAARPAPAPGNAGQIPTGTLLNNAPQNRPSSPAAMPSIGTKITSTPSAAKGVALTANLSNKTPQRSTNPLIIAQGKPTQAKNFVGLNPGQSALDKIISNFLKKTPGNVIQKALPKLFA